MINPDFVAGCSQASLGCRYESELTADQIEAELASEYAANDPLDGREPAGEIWY